jgi:hypothetical protein
MSLVRVWWRFGALPALPLVVLFFALLAAVSLLVDETTAGGVGGVLVVTLIAYCVARPANGTDLFLAVAAPGAIAQLGHELLGAPRWLYFVLLPIALIGAWSADHAEVACDEDDGNDAVEAPAARA